MGRKMKELWLKLFQGIFVGIALVLPGMSGGTAILILGIYREFLQDLSQFRLKKYVPMIMGIAFGVTITITVISFLLEQYLTILLSLLLGMLLASIKLVLDPLGRFRWSVIPVLAGICGFLITWFVLAGEPLTHVPVASAASPVLIFAGGAMASATMLLPGVSGSSILIMLNLYDDILMMFKQLVWPGIIYFSAGLGMGLFLFARLITSIYRRHKVIISFLLAGLILGAARSLLPENINAGVVLLAITGALVVLYFSRPK